MIVTISRQAASNGELIGRMVADRLGLRYFDRELVDELARRLHVDRDLVTRYDESSLNPVQSILFEWRSAVNEYTYREALRAALHRIQREGDAVVIGRGANFVMQGPDCLHVRIIGPLALRVAIYREWHAETSQADAERQVIHTDRDRARFVSSLFDEEIDNPDNYDLVINLHGITPEIATDIIARTAQERAAQGLPSGTEATLPRHVEVMTRHRRPTRPSIVERSDQEAA